MFTFNFLKTVFYTSIYNCLICWSDDSISTHDEVDELGKKLDRIEDKNISEWIQYFQSLVEKVRAQNERGETYINLGLLCNMHWKKKNFPERIQTQEGILNSDYAVFSLIGLSDDRILDELKSQECIPFPEIEEKYGNMTQ